jgi:predicted RNase H-like nuclease (RuvC/YqgF family)
LAKLTIVGIDFGITTGVAILDIQGKVLLIDSKREMKKEEIVKTIIKFGKPLIIASDVNPLPKSVEDIVNEFGSKAFFPENSLSVEEKNELTKEYSKILKNDHEKDALAAALKAWKSYREIFEKISIAYENAILKIFRKESENIESAIRDALKEKFIPEREVKLEEEYKKEIKSLEKKVREKENEIKRLQFECRRLAKSLKSLPRENFLFKNKTIENLEKEIEKLKQANEFLKKERELEIEGFYPVIELKKEDFLNLHEIDKKISLKNRIIFCDETEKIDLLNTFRIKALLLSKPPKSEVVGKVEFPILVWDKFENLFGIKCVKKNEIEEKIKSAKKLGLVEWLKKYRKRKL